MSRVARKVSWQAGGDPRTPYVATVDGERWEIRVGEPVAPPYILVVDGEVISQLAEWPAAWERPADDDPYLKREMELEEEKLQRSLGIKPSKLV